MLNGTLKRKTVTAVLTTATAFHCVFQVDYGDHDHVFSNLQKWYRRKWDQVLLGQEVIPGTTGPDKVTANRLKDTTDKVMNPLNKNQP